jgi:hypothetical protein
MGDNIKEIYVYTTSTRGREQFHVQDYEAPTENFVDIDTTNQGEFETFQILKKKIGL